MIPNPPQTDINTDAGVIQARRILDRLYQEEQAAISDHSCTISRISP
jgi:hypothetical protein